MTDLDRFADDCRSEVGSWERERAVMEEIFEAATKCGANTTQLATETVQLFAKSSTLPTPQQKLNHILFYFVYSFQLICLNILVLLFLVKSFVLFARIL